MQTGSDVRSQGLTFWSHVFVQGSFEATTDMA